MSEYVLEVRNITKRFPGVLANDQINLALIGSGIQGIYDTTSALRVPGVKLVAACDLRRENAEHLADTAFELLGARPRVFTDMGEKHIFWMLLALAAVVYVTGWLVNRSRLGFANLFVRSWALGSQP